jgi:radical SAM superfamily enzyme YgiQ (UPF0313 family)
MKDLKITLVELAATEDGKLEGPVAKDIYSHLSLPSRAIDLLQALSIKHGYRDVVTINTKYSKPSGFFTPAQWERLKSSDVVGISSITRTADQSYQLSQRIKMMNPLCWVIIGGPHTSALPDEGLEYADIIVHKEGDYTFVDIMDRIYENKLEPDLNSVRGISFKDNKGNLLHTPARPFLTSEELNKLPFPVYPMDVLKKLTHVVINLSRGCPFDCEYCAVVENFGRKFRYLDIDTSIALIEHTLKQANKRIFFGDDHFVANPTRTKLLLETILKRNIKLPPWVAQVRVESARDKELIKLMKRANCDRVCIGFESVNEETLKSFNKHATLEMNSYAIKAYHEVGISIHGMFVLGSDSDTIETAKQTVEYAKKNRLDTVQFFTLIPLPGTRLSRKYEEDGRIISKAWHKYDGVHAVIEPKNMSSIVLQKAIENCHLDFYSLKEGLKHLYYGNEHFFNFLIRIVGNKTARHVAENTKFYKQALEKLERWHNTVNTEYKAWSKKIDLLVGDFKVNAASKNQAIRQATEDLLKQLQEQKTAAEKSFRPFVQKQYEIVVKNINEKLEKLNIIINDAGLKYSLNNLSYFPTQS